MEENIVVDKSKKLPGWLITVTPFSKYLAMVLFVTLPFIGFILGMKYQKAIDLVIEMQTKPLVVNTTPTAMPVSKIAVSISPSLEPISCGDIPSNIQIKKDSFTMVNGPTWAPDCAHIAWSSWQSTFANPSIPVGLFVYDPLTEKTKLVYVPKEGQDEEDIELKKWQNSNLIVFTKNGQGVLYVYDLVTGKTSPLEKTK
jgi:hypothetical protein